MNEVPRAQQAPQQASKLRGVGALLAIILTFIVVLSVIVVMTTPEAAG